MPRSKPPPGPDAAEPRKRSRTGCWPCKARKVKCGEEKPSCANCIKSSEQCDYSIRLNWGGRAQKNRHSFSSTASTSVFSATPTIDTANLPFTSAQNAIASPRPPSSRPASSQYAPAMHSPLGIDTSHATSSSALSHKHYRTISSATPALESPYTPALPRPDHLDPHLFENIFSPINNAPTSSPALSVPRPSSSLRLPPFSPGLGSASPIGQSRHKRARTIDDGNHMASSLPTNLTSTVVPESALGKFRAYEHPSPSGSWAVSDGPSDGLSPSIRSSNPRGSFGLHTPHDRRLSVNSLLSAPSNDGSSTLQSPRLCNGHRSLGEKVYGYDYGNPDLDMPRNNDTTAIAPRMGNMQRFDPTTVSDLYAPEHSLESIEMAFAPGGYYATPVQIKISTRFDPLPAYLTQNPMNLLYFHHFLNHTARVLVPYDCEDNPLRTVMPEMAVREPNLLNLLLAYSASHRAKLLGHREPVNRIALWMRDAWPSLRKALSSSAPISDASLATAVLLCSLKIVSPTTFDVPLTWQDYLATARQIIVSRGGLEGLVNAGDKYVAFCLQWYCYIEAVGGLGSTAEEPLCGDYYAYGDEADSRNYNIDCFLGFTNRCMALIAKVAKLARQCDRERIDPSGEIRLEWRPSDEEIVVAQDLRVQLEHSMVHHGNKCCVHVTRPESPTSESTDEVKELHTSNTMYHLAALIHLYRRVLGRPSSDPSVQHWVDSILIAWTRIRKDSTYESCLLLPLFTAGCEVLDPLQRKAIADRLMIVVGWGLPHFSQACKLMQKSWESGKPWETLVSGEFLG